MRLLPAAFILLLLVVLAYFSYADLNSSRDLAIPWVQPVITQEEVAALAWVKANTVERELFVTDIFGGELLMGGALREGTEGGDWAIVPDVAQHMADIDRFYDTNSSQEAYAVAKKYGAKWAWVPNRQLFAGYGWKYAKMEKFGDARFFELAFDNQTKVFRVK